MNTKIGKVRMFNPEKGFVFLRMEGEERDIFFHYSQIVQEGFKTVDIDQIIEFELVESDKGLQAQTIVKL